jgi:hypothetical protein
MRGSRRPRLTRRPTRSSGRSLHSDCSALASLPSAAVAATLASVVGAGRRGAEAGAVGIATEDCASRLGIHERPGARFGNSQDEQARNGRRAGADVPI